MWLDVVKEVSHLGALDFSGRHSALGIIMSLSLPVLFGFKVGFVVLLLAFLCLAVLRLLFAGSTGCYFTRDC